MLNVAPELASGTPLQSFKTAYKAVAAFYGRPSSDTVLFSGLPDEITESMELEDVQQMAERIGLQVIQHSDRDCKTGNFDCPAIVVLGDGSVVPLLEFFAIPGRDDRPEHPLQRLGRDRGLPRDRAHLAVDAQHGNVRGRDVQI